MSADEVLKAVKTKAREIVGLPRPTNDDDMRDAQTRLGFPLHPLHAWVLLEVADGGLVPRMYGVGGQGQRDEGRGLVEMKEYLERNGAGDLPAFTVPFAELGCGAWLLVETRTGKVLGVDESGLVETRHTLESWLGDWAAGHDVVREMFEDDQPGRAGTNPFTKQPMMFASRGSLKGRRLSSWPKERG